MITALAMALAIGGAAAATSTYAWFRTTRTAEVNIANGQIYGDGSLTCAYAALGNNGVEASDVTGNTKNGFDIGLSADNMTDISGTGIESHLYQPVWDPNATDDDSTPLVDESLVATSIKARNNTSTQRYYMAFGITFGNLGNTAFDVYLQNGSKIVGVDANVPTEPTDAETTDPDYAALHAQYLIDKAAYDTAKAKQDRNDQSAKATRVAFWNGSNLIQTWQSDTTDGTTYDKYKYVVQTLSTEDSLYNVEGFKTETLAEATTLVGAPTLLSTIADTTTHANQKVATLGAYGSATATQTVYCTIWIEGTLSLATAACIGGQINASLHFVAL